MAQLENWRTAAEATVVMMVEVVVLLAATAILVAIVATLYYRLREWQRCNTLLKQVDYCIRNDLRPSYRLETAEILAALRLTLVSRLLPVGEQTLLRELEEQLLRKVSPNELFLALDHCLTYKLIKRYGTGHYRYRLGRPSSDPAPMLRSDVVLDKAIVM